MWAKLGASPGSPTQWRLAMIRCTRRAQRVWLSADRSFSHDRKPMHSICMYCLWLEKRSFNIIHIVVLRIMLSSCHNNFVIEIYFQYIWKVNDYFNLNDYLSSLWRNKSQWGITAPFLTHLWYLILKYFNFISW